MNKNDSGLSKKLFTQILLIIAFTIFAIYAFFNFDSFLTLTRTIFSALTPFFVGLAIAFILNLLFNFFDKIVFKSLNKRFEKGKIWVKISKPISLMLSYLVLILAFILLLLILIPELARSINSFAQTASEVLPTYLSQFIKWIEGLIIQFNLDIDLYAIQESFLSNFDIAVIIDGFTQTATDIFASVFSTTVNVAAGVFTIVLSFIFSIYFLSDKETLIKNSKKLLYSYVPRRYANRISMVLSISNKIFSGYIRGQLTECLILGTMCYIGMSLLSLDYSLLISTFVAVFALIPMFGAFIGAGIGAFLILLVNPMDALYFLIFFIILQQFEGNVIYPRVMGSSLGLPGVWIITSVTVMGNLFGIGGILLGPPVLAVFYTLIKYHCNKRLKEKEIDANVLSGSEYEEIYQDILLQQKNEKDSLKKSENSAVLKRIPLAKKKNKK